MGKRYVILWGNAYVRKQDGMNLSEQNPRYATHFDSREDARDARPGHHKDMGGKGFSGTVVDADTARRNYESAERRRLKAPFGWVV